MIGIGNILLLILTNNTNIILLVSNFIFIQLLSIFYSVYYLVIYYLLQPFDKNMEVKKVSYSLVNMIFYMLCCIFIGIDTNTYILSLVGIIICLLFIVISLLLVKKFSPKTFKLN